MYRKHEQSLKAVALGLQVLHQFYFLLKSTDLRKSMTMDINSFLCTNVNKFVLKGKCNYT